jgi:hypothetical protein
MIWKTENSFMIKGFSGFFSRVTETRRHIRCTLPIMSDSFPYHRVTAEGIKVQGL